MFKNLIVIIALLAGSFSATATSTLGGDITWDCLGNGKYQFTVSVFYTCDSTTAAPADSVIINTNANVAPMVCFKSDSVDVSPNCGGNSGISCGGNSNYGGLVRIEYKSAEMVLPGVPSANGWIFYTDLCCRGTLNNSSSDTTMTLRSVMYAPSNVASAFPCYDSSPKFLEIPHIYFASFTQQNLALADLSDVDADSVSIEWSQPWDAYDLQTQTPTPMPFDSAYAFNTPLPDSAVDPANNQGVLNEASGHYKFYQVSTGKFATSLKLTAYRQGQKIAEVNRDLPMIILPNVQDSGVCASANNIPDISAISLNQNSLSPGLSSNGDTAFYKIQVQPGDTVSLKIAAFNSNLKPNCLPQNITFTGTGAALSLDSLYQDATQTAINGLAATLKPFGTQNGFVTTVNNQVEFNWIVEKNHVAFPGKSHYQFNFRFTDNNCNLTGTAEMAIRVSINRPIFLSNDTTAICNGDSARVEVSGDLSNLSWSPQTGVGSGQSGEFYLSPAQTTFYTLTDLTSGYTETVFVRVDNIVKPFIAVGINSFELLNPNNYDSIYWTINQAPIFTPTPNNAIVPALSGSYRTVNSNGVCIETSNFLDTTIAGNFTLNPDTKGVYGGLDQPDATFGMNIKYNGSSPLKVKQITIAANYFTPNVKLKFKVFDFNLVEIFSTDSVVATQNQQLKAYGTFTLQPNQLYFVSLYLGDSTNFYLYKAKNWPIISNNGLISIFNSARADGNVPLPSVSSAFFPFIHFHTNSPIGINENNLRPVFSVFPNPVNGTLYLSLKGDYKIYNITGIVVKQARATSNINVASLASGVYWIRNSQGAVVKFVKE